jgi:hypothetical protein
MFLNLIVINFIHINFSQYITKPQINMQRTEHRHQAQSTVANLTNYSSNKKCRKLEDELPLFMIRNIPTKIMNAEDLNSLRDFVMPWTSPTLARINLDRGWVKDKSRKYLAEYHTDGALEGNVRDAVVLADCQRILANIRSRMDSFFAYMGVCYPHHAFSTLSILVTNKRGIRMWGLLLAAGKRLDQRVSCNVMLRLLHTSQCLQEGLQLQRLDVILCNLQDSDDTPGRWKSVGYLRSKTGCSFPISNGSTTFRIKTNDSFSGKCSSSKLIKLNCLVFLLCRFIFFSLALPSICFFDLGGIFDL